MAAKRAGVITVDFVAQSGKLQSDTVQASGKLGRLGESGRAAGRAIGAGMAQGADGVRRLGSEAARSSSSVDRHRSSLTYAAEAASLLAVTHAAAGAALAKYSGDAEKSAAATGRLVSVIRTARIEYAAYQSVVAQSFAPLFLASAGVAAGVLAEQAVRLTTARAKLIESQSLYSATSGTPFSSVDLLDRISKQTGGANTRGLFSALQAKFANDQNGVQSTLDNLGVKTGIGDPAVLAKIAYGFQQIEDPVKRDQAAVKLFGTEAGLALSTLSEGFARTAEREQEFGTALTETDRVSIANFRRDVESLKTSVKEFFSIDLSWFDNFKTGVAKDVAGLWDLIQALAKASNDFASKKGFVWDVGNPPGLPKAPAAAGGAIGLRETADQTQAEVEAANRRAAESTIEGQRGVAAAAEQRSKEALAKLKSDDEARELYRTQHQVNPSAYPSPPSTLLNEGQRLALAQEAQSSALLSEVTKTNVRMMESSKSIVELLSQRFSSLNLEMEKAAMGISAVGKSQREKQEIEADEVVQASRVEAARAQISATTKPGEPVLAPTAGQISNALPKDIEDKIRQAALAKIVTDAEKSWREEIQRTAEALERRIEVQNILTEAIGKTYRERQSSKIESELIDQFKEDYANPARQSDVDRVRELKTMAADSDAEKSWREEIDKTTEAIGRRIQVQNILTDAIGKTYRERQSSKIESELIDQFKEDYTNPERQPEIDRVRGVKTVAADSERAGEVAKTNQSLSQEIELQRSLTAAQKESKEAVELVTLAYKLRNLSAEGLSGEIAKEIELFNAKKATAEAASKRSDTESQQDQIDKLDIEIEGERKLAEAQLQGADVVRRQTLENKLAMLDYESASTDVFDTLSAKTKALEETKNKVSVLKDALSTSAAYSDQLSKLEKELAVINELEAKQGATRDLEVDRLAIEKQISETLAKQALQTGTLMDGLKAFLENAAASAKKPGEILYDGLNHAVDGVSDELSKLETGQKANFGKMLQEVGGGIAKDANKALIQKALGAFGVPKSSSTSARGGGPFAGAKAGAGGANDPVGLLKPGQDVKYDGQSPAGAIFVQNPQSAANNPAPLSLTADQVSSGFDRSVTGRAIVKGFQTLTKPKSAGQRFLDDVVQPASGAISGALLKKFGKKKKPTDSDHDTNADGTDEDLGSYKNKRSSGKIPDDLKEPPPSDLPIGPDGRPTLMKAPRGGDQAVGPTGYPNDPIYVASQNSGNQGPGLSPLGALSPGMLLGGFGGGSTAGGVPAFAGSAADAGGAAESVTSSISYGGEMADGGPVTPDTAYWVGENGPEPFIPKSHGTIIPNGALEGGGDTYHVTQNFDARNADIGVANRLREAAAVHKAAVKDGIRAAHEEKLRTPQR